MTALSDLIGPRSTLSPATAGYWQRVPEWSLGGNDKFGDCAFVALCNYIDLLTAVNGDPQLVPEAEAEHFYSVEAGFSPLNSATDKGETLVKILEYWTANGWPGDPTLVPAGWCQIEAAQIHQAVWGLGAVYAWVMLPPSGDEGWDFSDAAPTAGIAGTGAHAVLVVGSDADSLWIVTWAKVVKVSRAWWAAYGQQCYAIRLPGWVVPG